MKKFLALLLSAVMIAAFAGCGAKQEGSSGESKTSETSAAEVQTTEKTQETLAPDIKNQLDQMLKNNKFNGVVQITKGDDVVYQYVDGNDDNGKPLTIDASMPIASPTSITQRKRSRRQKQRSRPGQRKQRTKARRRAISSAAC